MKVCTIDMDKLTNLIEKDCISCFVCPFTQPKDCVFALARTGANCNFRTNTPNAVFLQYKLLFLLRVQKGQITLNISKLTFNL